MEKCCYETANINQQRSGPVDGIPEIVGRKYEERLLFLVESYVIGREGKKTNTGTRNTRKGRDAAIRSLAVMSEV